MTINPKISWLVKSLPGQWNSEIEEKTEEMAVFGIFLVMVWRSPLNLFFIPTMIYLSTYLISDGIELCLSFEINLLM